MPLRRFETLTLMLAVYALSTIFAGPLGAQETSLGTESRGGAALSWVRLAGAESCADRVWILQAVERRLGYDPERGPIRLHLEATVSFEAGIWIAQIYSHNAYGESVGTRTLRSTAANCQSLGEAVALAMALSIDPKAVQGPSRASEPASTPPPAVSGPVRSLRSKPWLEGRTVGAIGMLPNFAFGAGLFGAMPVSDSWEIAAQGTLLPEQRLSAPSGRYAFAPDR